MTMPFSFVVPLVMESPKGMILPKSIAKSGEAVIPYNTARAIMVASRCVPIVFSVRLIL